MLKDVSSATKKQLGAFYTPRLVADLLCQWAIRAKTDRVLEPSFGGCDFLVSSQSRFLRLDTRPKKIEQLLYGCDIDPDAFSHLTKVFEHPNGNFILNDFLQLDRNAFPRNRNGFDVVIGNPPYVSHHNMAESQKNAAVEALAAHGIVLGGRASLWAYFVLHSLHFLRPGGRMAWVLPSSFLFADYSEQVHTHLQQHFERCLIIRLAERLFLSEGTEEISVITLCDGYSEIKQAGEIQTEFVTSANDTKNIIKRWAKPASKIPLAASTNTFGIIKAAKYYDVLSKQAGATTLGTLFDIQIGIVSGANHFFILNQEKWHELKLPNTCKTLVLTKFRFVPGLTLKPTDIANIQNQGNPCLLVDTTKAKSIDGHLKAYLDTFPDEKRETTTTFQRRERSGVWHRFNDNRIPAAFLSYMHDKGPSIALNSAGVNSTNSIHRLYLRQLFTERRLKLIAISMLSTFSQLSAEFEGRTYGAGVLKHEPSEAARIELILPEVSSTEIDKAFTKIDKLLRQGQREQARQVADALVLRNTTDEIRANASLVLAKELALVRNRRYPKTKQTAEK